MSADDKYLCNMRTFIEKLCDRYKVSETDVQSLLNCMEEVISKREI
ncbi:cAMP-binding proteins - catabolite gene activator and regulatory subunit of cAMP-dependent protein kinases [Bacteroides ovatus]|nr:cAMP-binding proteins - catabolite gene activator and regulatory subunit of cAMP-dependent protein kinases [Bacteroides ovatus]